MNISPIDPIGKAWNRMVLILFKPFKFKKWLLLGFCAFLAQCGEGGGGGGNYSNGWEQDSSDSGNSTWEGRIDDVRNWIDENLVVFVASVASLALIILAICLLVTWISSRGKFMFLDGVVKNRGAVKEPWTEYRREGNSLFLFRVLLGLIALLGFGIAAGVPFVIALGDIQAGVFGTGAIIAIIAAAILFIPYIIACIAVSFMVDVFVLPAMYLRRVRAFEGWRIAWRELVRQHIGSALLLFLMLLILGIGVGVVVVLATCLTCCITAIPYVGTVLLLPIPVFFAAYVLEYIQQFGDDWQFYATDPADAA
jgi:hypothetical protein